MDTPPANDCCPICFSDFTFPCRTNCGHWYCSSCILEYWSYGGVALKPCKCPLCGSGIKGLTPEKSLRHSTDTCVVDAMKHIDQYNQLFVGGIYVACLARIREFPLMMRRLGMGLMNPDTFGMYLSIYRYLSLIMRLIYGLIGESDYDLTGTLLSPEIVLRVLDYTFLVLGIANVIGFYHRRRLAQRVRRLAALDHNLFGIED